MTRPKSKFKIGFCPPCSEFRPSNCRDEDCIVEITAEQAEALRLKNLKDLDQTQAAKKMGVSQSTFQRVLASAYKKVSEAIVEGKTLKIKEVKQ